MPLPNEEALGKLRPLRFLAVYAARYAITGFQEAVSTFGALSVPGRVLPYDRQMGNVLTHLDKAKVDQFCHVGLVDYPFSL